MRSNKQPAAMMTWQLQRAAHRPRQLLNQLTTTAILILLLVAFQKPQLAAALCENGISTGTAGVGSPTYRTIAYCPLNISSGADANIFPVTTTCNNNAVPDWSFQLHDITPGTPSKYTWGYVYHTVYTQIAQDIDGVEPAHAWVDADLSVHLAHIAIHCSTWTSGQPPCQANVSLVLSCPLVSANDFGPVAPPDEPPWTCAQYPEQCRALGIPTSTPAPPKATPAKTPESSANPPQDDASTDPPETAPNPPPPPGGVSTYFNYTKQLGGADASSTKTSSSKKKVSVWVIVGAVVGGLLLLIILEEVFRHYRNKHREKKRVAAEGAAVVGTGSRAPETAAAGAAVATGTRTPGLRSRSASLVEKGAYKPAG